MRFLIVLVLSLMSLSCANISATELHSGWDLLLKKHVVNIDGGNSTAINYAGVKEDSAELDRYIKSLTKVSTSTYDSWTSQEQLAFLMNAYNAYTVQLIITKYPDLESIKELGSFFSSPWAKERGLLLGKVRTLNDIEHKMIRGENGFNEPRIHFAVNCASIGCPALRAEAYTGEKLELQLEEQTKSFLGDRTRNRLEDDELYISKIFDWYKEDFKAGWKGSDSLAQFLILYADALSLTPQQVNALKKGDIDIEFLDYNWELNDAKN